MKYCLVLLLALSLQACSRTKVIPLTGQDVLDSPYLSFNPPDNGWYTFNDKSWRDYYDKGQKFSIYIYKKVPTNKGNAILTVIVQSNVRIYRPKSMYFNPNADIDFEAKREAIRNLPDNIRGDKERGITYRRSQTTYVQGLKCQNIVHSARYGGSVYNAGGKQYRLSCGYYHQSGQRRGIEVIYRYFGAVPGKDKEGLFIINNAEKALKEGVKAVIESLVIKGADWERMKKESLLHDKPYQTIKW